MKLLLLALIFLLALIYLTRKWKTINSILISITTTLFLLIISDVIYRVFVKGPELYHNLYESSENIEYDSILNYKWKAGRYDVFATLGKTDTVFSTTYTIIPDTLDAKYKFDHRVGFKNSDDSLEAVFIGCSFTFGDGVADTLTLPYTVGKLENISTVNLGVSGWGINQIYENFITRYQTRDNRNRVFVYSLLSDHFLRANAVYYWNNTGPFYTVNNDSLVQTGTVNHNNQPNNYQWVNFASLSGSLQFIRLLGNQVTLKNNIRAFSENDYQRYLMMIRKMREMAEKSGGRFILLHYDNNNWGQSSVSLPQQDKLDRDIKSFQTNGMEVLSISTIVDYHDKSLFIPGDGHPNGLLYQRVARHLGPMMRVTKNKGSF